YIQKTSEQIVIRGEGQFTSLEDIERTAIRTSKDGIPLLLTHVGTVQTGPALRFGVITKNGKGEVVGGTVAMLLGENSRVVLKSIKEKMKELEKKLPEGMKIENFYDRGDFINETLGTVFTNLAEGAFLVFICLIVTLGTVKGGILVASAIPISMLFAVIFMRIFGVVGNLMSLGAIDFGLLVDGSIVMLEALMSGFILKKHLFENLTTKSEVRQLSQEIIKESCIRVARAAAFSVAIIMLVYLPLMALEGVEGRMFRPMAITVALALAGALLFSITTFPAGLSYLYDIPEFHHSHYWDVVTNKYNEFIHKAFAGPRKMYILSGFGFFVFAIFLASFLGSEFIPRIYEGELNIDMKRLPSTALDHSRDLNLEVERVLLAIPEVTSVVSKMGRGESAAEPIGTEEGELMLKLIPRTKSWGNKFKSLFMDESKLPKEGWTSSDPYDLDGMMNFVKDEITNKVPSSYVSISQPIENRVNALLSGSKADVVIKIYGENLGTLKELATQLATIIKTVPGNADLRVQRVLGLPMLEIKVNREKMARYGVKAHEILSTIETMRVGANVGKVFEGIKRFDLVVRLDVDLSGNNFDFVHDIPVMTSSGTTVPLGLVADIRQIEGPAAIYREALSRRIFVEVNVRGRDLVGFVSEAQAKTEELIDKFPEGYSVKWGGQFENFTRAKNRLVMVVPIALLIIFSMLIGAFGNVFYAVGVYSVVPFAITGGVISLFLRSLPFSIPAGVGFIAVCGISVLNGVVYASTLKAVRQENPSEDLMKDVINSALISVRPVITTALVAAIGFIPMAIAKGAGAEVQRPLASVVIGGIITSTLLSGVLLPMIMYGLLGKANSLERKRKLAMEESDKYEIDKH
ncbi:MAG: efflux RND transporter permease subunit, partial [Leptospiraceae bacterium]|nr:efflux RND transporter permease subunit [Leptospiraceae bacterium]